MGTQTRGIGQQSAANIALSDNQRLEYYKMLWNNRGSYNTTSFLLSQTLLGSVTATDTWNMYSTEQDFVDWKYEVDAVTVPAVNPGDPVTVRLTAASHDSVTGQSMIQETDILTIGVDRAGSYVAVQGQVTNVVYTANANVVTIQPSLSTYDFSPAGANEMTAGTVMTILSNSQPEGGPSRRSVTSTFRRYPVDKQIMRFSYNTTGSAMAIGTQIPNMAGVGDSQVLYDVMLRERDALVQMDGALLTQSKIDTPAYGETFDGLVPTIVGRGGIVTTTPGGGAYTRSYVEGLCSQISAQGGTREYLFYRGLGNLAAWQSCLNDYPVGSVRFADPPDPNGKGFSINEQFDRLSTLGFVFRSVEMERWTHPNLEGATDVGDYYNAAVGIPNGKVSESGATGGYWRLLYLAKNGYSRRMISWQWGGMADSNKNGDDVKRYESLSECGPQYFGVNNFIFERGGTL